MSIEIEVDRQSIARMLRLMFGPLPTLETSDPAQAQWLDEGGALHPDEREWTHTIRQCDS